MSLRCEFCDNIFLSKITLGLHQKKAKYCLKIQGKNPTLYTCDKCEKTFQHKHRLLIHMEKCDIKSQVEKLKETIQCQKETIIKLSTIIVEKQEQIHKNEQHIKDLTNKLENVAIKGVTKSTNTNINNIKIECLTDEHLQNCAKLLTAKDIVDANSLARFAVENSFKNRVYPTDRSRKTLVWKKEDGKISKDPKGRQLAVKFFSSIKERDDVIVSVREQIVEELSKLGQVDEKEREYILDRMNQIVKVEKGVTKISADEEHELREEFVEKLCEILPNAE